MLEEAIIVDESCELFLGHKVIVDAGGFTFARWPGRCCHDAMEPVAAPFQLVENAVFADS
jgi:hypothetical protein